MDDVEVQAAWEVSHEHHPLLHRLLHFRCAVEGEVKGDNVVGASELIGQAGGVEAREGDVEVVRGGGRAWVVESDCAEDNTLIERNVQIEEREEGGDHHLECDTDDEDDGSENSEPCAVMR